MFPSNAKGAPLKSHSWAFAQTLLPPSPRGTQTYRFKFLRKKNGIFNSFPLPLLLETSWMQKANIQCYLCKLKVEASLTLPGTAPSSCAIWNWVGEAAQLWSLFWGIPCSYNVFNISFMKHEGSIYISILPYFISRFIQNIKRVIYYLLNLLKPEQLSYFCLSTNLNFLLI